MGISQNAAASTPTTAPNVLLAYNAAIDLACPRPRSGAVRRSIAGSVAPIAAVAGRNRTNVAQNATDHCHAADGWAPVSRRTASLKGGATSNSSRPHTPAISSHATYQRTGHALRSRRAPSASAPTASPPKNAARTASTAADSCPSHKEHCCVQMIS